jgi:asparagine N-glycosylation enzyme membrane subunit Stt3
MKPNEHKEFPWTGLFFVTAVSFLVFGIFIKFIRGAHAHITLFLLIGCVSLGLGLLSLIAGLSTRRMFKKP